MDGWEVLAVVVRFRPVSPGYAPRRKVGVPSLKLLVEILHFQLSDGRRQNVEEHSLNYGGKFVETQG